MAELFRVLKPNGCRQASVPDILVPYRYMKISLSPTRRTGSAPSAKMTVRIYANAYYVDRLNAGWLRR